MDQPDVIDSLKTSGLVTPETPERMETQQDIDQLLIVIKDNLSDLADIALNLRAEVVACKRLFASMSDLLKTTIQKYGKTETAEELLRMEQEYNEILNELSPALEFIRAGTVECSGEIETQLRPEGEPDGKSSED